MWRWAFALALLFAALIDAEPLKRAEMSAAPFVLGSRYGRSAQRMLTPRNDRFFLGSRYGKRGVADARGRDVRTPWRPACDCRATRAAGALRNYYMRRPESMQRSPEQD